MLMGKITGKLYSGAEFKKNVGIRTKKFWSNDDIRSIDTTQIVDAKNLESVQITSYPIQEICLSNLNKCENLNYLYLKLATESDLSSLKEHPSLTTLGLIFTEKVGDFLEDLPKNLESLSLTFGESVELDLNNLPSNLKTLRLSGKIQNLDLAPLAELKLQDLSFEKIALNKLELPESGLENLESFCYRLGSFDTFFTSALSKSKKLKFFNLTQSNWNYLFLDGIAELEMLSRVFIGDTNRAYISEGFLSGEIPIRSYGIRELQQLLQCP
jgi:hypothetical protein